MPNSNTRARERTCLLLTPLLLLMLLCVFSFFQLIFHHNSGGSSNARSLWLLRGLEPRAAAQPRTRVCVRVLYRFFTVILRGKVIVCYR